MPLFAALPKVLEDWARDQPLWVQILTFLLVIVVAGVVLSLWKRWTEPKPPTPPPPA